MGTRRCDRYTKAIACLLDEIKPAKYAVSFTREIDFAKIHLVQEHYREAGRRKPSYTSFLVAATTRVLRRYPQFNKRVFKVGPFLFSQEFGSQVDVSVAVERLSPDTPQMAYNEIVRNAQDKTIEEVTAELSRFAKSDESSSAQWRAFINLVRRSPALVTKLILRIPLYWPTFWVRWRGGAILVTSPAKYGVDSITGTWQWPLTISFGLVKERPIVIAGEVRVRPTCIISFNWDRRLMAGAQAAILFNEIAEMLEEAERLEGEREVATVESP